MIPKTIHYCWFSGAPYPDLVKRCLRSWKRMMPDYKLRLWDGNSFDFDSVPYVREAMAAKKYAVEGFADGYMWGAISSVLKITGKNFKRLKAFKMATGGSAAIKADGTVFDEAGKRIGQAFYDNENVWHLVDETSGVYFEAKAKNSQIIYGRPHLVFLDKRFIT